MLPSVSQQTTMVPAGPQPGAMLPPGPQTASMLPPGSQSGTVMHPGSQAGYTAPTIVAESGEGGYSVSQGGVYQQIPEYYPQYYHTQVFIQFVKLFF